MPGYQLFQVVLCQLLNGKKPDVLFHFLQTYWVLNAITHFYVSAETQCDRKLNLLQWYPAVAPAERGCVYEFVIRQYTIQDSFQFGIAHIDIWQGWHLW